MGLNFDESAGISEYGNWNVAAEYSKLKIMKPLFLADDYERIATFGSTEFYDDTITPENVDLQRIKGFQRLVKELILVINNSLFAIRDKCTHKTCKETLNKFKQELEKYYKVVPVLFKDKVDQRKGTSRLVLRTENFDKALSRVSEIKALINDPLNKHDLIFTYREEFDPVKAKADIFELATTRG